MAILEMKKVRVITYGKETSKLLEAMQKMGSFEFIDVSDSYPDYELNKHEKTAFEFNYVSSRLDFAVNFLSKFQKKNFLRKALEDGREFISQDEIEKIARTFYFNDAIEMVSDLETKINEAKQKIQKLNEEEEILSLWEALPLSLGIELQTKLTETLFLSSKEKKEDLFSKLDEKKCIYSFYSVSDENFTLTFFKKDKEDVLEAISEFGAEIVELPRRRGSPQEELERIRRAKIKAEKEITKAQIDAQKISNEHLSKLRILSDYFYWKKQKDDILTGAMGTGNIFVFEGWCPSKKTSELKTALLNASQLFAIEELEIKENEIPPVEIENNKLFKPFETVTRLYGLPGHKDLDPTVFHAGFFFIFFGLCLTDVFYGLTILLIFSLILLFYRVPKEIKPLYILLMLGGLASVIVGFFFGGYAGIDIKFFPEWMKKIQFFDPIASPLAVFYLSLAMGVLQVMAGIFVKILTDAKNNNLKGGLLDNVPWLLLFFLMILFIGGKFGVWTNFSFIDIMLYISLASIVLTHGRAEKSIFSKGIKGVLGLYASVGYFSDILSYSRLLALGLATSALAFSINLIALLARDLVPYVGLILMVIILIIGHLFNLVINILGAFIHSARLQFVEFFGKFLMGGGRNFKPFRQEERNVVIIK